MCHNLMRWLTLDLDHNRNISSNKGTGVAESWESNDKLHSRRMRQRHVLVFFFFFFFLYLDEQTI